MPTRKEAPKPDHLSRILDAATELFLEAGFSGTTIDDIAKRAKVSKREIYLHFADRPAVLSGCIARMQGDVGAEMDIEWSSDADLRSLLVHAGNKILKLILSEKFRNVFRLVAAESLTDRNAARQFYRLGPEAGRQRTAKVFERQMKNGTLVCDDPLQAADDFLDLVITARLMTAVAIGNATRAMVGKDHVEHAVDIFLTYYAPAYGKDLRKPVRRKSSVRKALPKRSGIQSSPLTVPKAG
jgi:TetR/AcrR family transcriptional repressor of mexJK operon